MNDCRNVDLTRNERGKYRQGHILTNSGGLLKNKQ